MANTKYHRFYSLLDLKKGKTDVLWDTFCHFFNLTVKDVARVGEGLEPLQSDVQPPLSPGQPPAPLPHPHFEKSGYTPAHRP